MKEHFLTYEQSLAVKELGFEEDCMGWYAANAVFYTDNKITINSGLLLAPLKSQFFKWAREKYGIKRQQVSYDDDYDSYWYEKWCDTYEEAEDACINGIIELIKNK